MVKVILYATGGSVYCNMVRNFLKKHNIKFEEKRIDLDDNAMKELLKLVPEDGVPALVVDNKVYMYLSEDELRKIFKIRA